MKNLQLLTALCLFLVILPDISFAKKSGEKKLGEGFTCSNSTIHKGKNKVFSLAAATEVIQKKINKLGNSKKDKASKNKLNKVIVALNDCLNGSFTIDRQLGIYTAYYPNRSTSKTTDFNTAYGIFAAVSVNDYAAGTEICVVVDRGDGSEKRYYRSGLSTDLCELLYEDESDANEVRRLCPAEYHDLRVVYSAQNYGDSDDPFCVKDGVCGIPDITNYFTSYYANWRYGISVKPENFGCPGL